MQNKMLHHFVNCILSLQSILMLFCFWLEVKHSKMATKMAAVGYQNRTFTRLT